MDSSELLAPSDLELLRCTRQGALCLCRPSGRDVISVRDVIGSVRDAYHSGVGVGGGGGGGGVAGLRDVLLDERDFNQNRSFDVLTTPRHSPNMLRKHYRSG